MNLTSRVLRAVPILLIAAALAAMPAGAGHPAHYIVFELDADVRFIRLSDEGGLPLASRSVSLSLLRRFLPRHGVSDSDRLPAGGGAGGSGS